MFLEEWRKPTGCHVAKLQCDQCQLVFERHGCPRDVGKSRHFCSKKCTGTWQKSSPLFSASMSKFAQRRFDDPEERKKSGDRFRAFYNANPSIVLKRSHDMAKRWQDPAYRESMSGTNHPLAGQLNAWWQPWMVKDIEGRAWSMQVKQLFRRRCALCGERRGLHAHHVIPKSIAPELRYDINNGIALCQRCHDGKDNCENVHKLLRESPARYKQLMQELLLKRTRTA